MRCNLPHIACDSDTSQWLTVCVECLLLRVVTIITTTMRRLPTGNCLLVHAPLTRRPDAAAGREVCGLRTDFLADSVLQQFEES